MQSTKATIKFIDQGFKRVVLLSDQYGTLLLYNVYLNGHKEGDEVSLFREEEYFGPERRQTDRRKSNADWQMAEGE